LIEPGGKNPERERGKPVLFCLPLRDLTSSAEDNRAGLDAGCPMAPAPWSPLSMSALAEPHLLPLARECGIPLPAYREAHVRRCVERALTRTGTSSVAELTDRLRHDGRARAAFRRSVLVPVTRMFRDHEEFELLEHTVIPRLLDERDRVEVWSAGCARGDELHSVAVILDRAGALGRASMLGSDVDTEALAAAAKVRDELPANLGTILRYEQRDLVLDPAPAQRFDLILCRNMMIYLERAAQDELRGKLAKALRPGGFLMLGRSEVLVRPASVGLERISRHIFRRPRP
jgi:chemotaxis protein methyltransferase CheR